MLNEDLDLDEEEQRSLLEFVRDAFLYTTEAAVTAEWDAGELGEYLAGSELDGTLQGLERYRENGHRQI